MRALLTAAATAAVATAAAAGGGSPFVVPPANAGFVPVLRDGTDVWLYLSSLRRSGFPMIAQNQPARTLFVPTARDRPRCGITPVLKGLGYEGGTCWPGALAWAWGYPLASLDRTTYLLALHSTNERASTTDVWGEPLHAAYLPSGAPWEVLLARAEARLRWDPGARGFVTPFDMWVDTPASWSRASSPQVQWWDTVPLRRQLADGGSAGGSDRDATSGGGRALYDGWNATGGDRLFDGDGGSSHHREFSLFGSQFELVDGLIHPSVEARAAYPSLTALQHIFLSPLTTAFAQLVNASCWCPDPAVTACPLSYLCFILDRAVFSLLLPSDAAVNRLSCGAWDFLLANPEAAAAVVEYHLLGQVTFVCPLTGPLRCSVPIVMRRLRGGVSGANAAEARAMSARVNDRLRQLGALRAAADASWAAAAAAESGIDNAQASAAAQEPPPVTAAAADGAPASHDSRARGLGFLGGAAGDLPELPREVDDFLLWSTTPFFAPWPSWMYHEQLGDLPRNTHVVAVQTFHALLGANVSALVPGLDWASLFNWTGSPSSGPILSDFIPFAPAELLLSYGPAYPCRAGCSMCQRCRDDCDDCRDGVGLPRLSFSRRRQRRMGATTNVSAADAAPTTPEEDAVVAALGAVCTDACGCQPDCYDCECCRINNAGKWPGPLRRRMESAGTAAAADAEGGTGDNDDEDVEVASPPNVPRALPPLDAATTALLHGRGLCDGCYEPGAFASPLTVTCADPGCGVADWSCEAQTVPPYVDIETLNGILHVIDNILLPPDVLWALWRNGTRAYKSSPPVGHMTNALPALGDCPFLPAGYAGVNGTLLGIGVAGIFRLIDALAGGAGAGHGRNW